MEIKELLKNHHFSKEGMKQKSIAYNKDYAKAVKCFQDRINKDRAKAGQKPLPYMAIKSKLAAVLEIDDLRSFYKTCCDYKYKKKGNTFSKAFFGGLKIK